MAASPEGVFEPVPGRETPTLELIAAALERQASIPVGGRLRFFWRKWRALGASKRVVRTLRKGYLLPFRKGSAGLVTPELVDQCPTGLISGYPHDPLKQSVLEEKVAELLSKNAIAPAPVGTKCFFNRVFLVDKKGGGHRLILDVSALNDFLDCQTFAMDTVKVIRAAAGNARWATSVDFSDAYHHIPIRPEHYRFLCFRVGGKLYWYIALPFGLSTAPRLFTDVLAPVKAWARLRDMVLFQYLDDWLNLADSCHIAQSRTLQFVSVCVDLGLLVNLAKSELVPKQVIDFLGFTWDFQRRRIYPTQQAMVSVQSSLGQVAAAASAPKLSLLESLLGKLVSVEKAVPWGRLNFRHVQRCFLIALRRYGRCSSVRVHLTSQALMDLQWWTRLGVSLTGCPLVLPPPLCTLQTDASTQGWGIVRSGRMWGGRWSPVEQALHINVLELRAVRLACLKFASEFRARHVHFQVDNVTAVAYINKQGGTHSVLMMREARLLFEVLQQHQMVVTASHIAGELNALADLASRQGQVLQTEWHLCQSVFTWVLQQSLWGPPLVDMFANRVNRQLSAFVSPCPDERAMATDALACDWPTGVLYAFPPTTLLQRLVLKLTRVPRCKLLLIAPDLPVAPWYPSLRRMAISPPLRLPSPVGMLRQPHWDCLHPQPEKLKLSLWHVRVSGPAV